eukprot:6081534-Prorocentrum_lima.AAC.1
MTSSLVGSEMCIRDSPYAEYMHDRVYLSCPSLRRSCELINRREEDASKAVSYTHLTLPTICSV